MMGFILFLEIAILAYMAVHIYYDKRLGMPTVPSSKQAVEMALAQVPPDTSGKILELGSGYGGLAIAAARRFPACEVVAIEFAPLPYWISVVRKKMNPELKNLTFLRQDFFEYSFSDARIVLGYVLQPLLEKLKAKFREMPAGGLIVLNHYSIPGWTAEKALDIEGLFDKKVFVYRMPVA